TAELTPRHQKLAPGRDFYELLVLSQVSQACTSKLAPGVSSRRLGLVCSRLGMSEAESGLLGMILGAWASSSSAATFPGLF
ncbi:hypothetical protein PIB30_060369, partial [Stylosanthes scabra]|nr:hypothetical protein [Stylosanthes scabra]